MEHTSRNFLPLCYNFTWFQSTKRPTAYLFSLSLPMAFSISTTSNSFASNTSTLLLPNFTQMPIEKLVGSNDYLAWLSQIEPLIQSNDLIGIIDGSKICPPQFLSNEERSLNLEFPCWTKKGQFLLGWINTTLSRRVLSKVFGLKTSKLVWSSLSNKFSSQSNSRVAHIKRELQGLCQGSTTCFEYIQTANDFG